MDWSTAILRREVKAPVDKGGRSALFTTAHGLDMHPPLPHFLRTNGEKAWFGWTNRPKIEELRSAWADAADLKSGGARVPLAFSLLARAVTRISAWPSLPAPALHDRPKKESGFFFAHTVECEPIKRLNLLLKFGFAIDHNATTGCSGRDRRNRRLAYVVAAGDTALYLASGGLLRVQTA